MPRTVTVYLSLVDLKAGQGHHLRCCTCRRGESYGGQAAFRSIGPLGVISRLSDVCPFLRAAGGNGHLGSVRTSAQIAVFIADGRLIQAFRHSDVFIAWKDESFTPFIALVLRSVLSLCHSGAVHASAMTVLRLTGKYEAHE